MSSVRSTEGARRVAVERIPYIEVEGSIAFSLSLLCRQLSRLRARSPRGLTVHWTVRQCPRFRFATPGGSLNTGRSKPLPYHTTFASRRFQPSKTDLHQSVGFHWHIAPSAAEIPGGASPSPTIQSVGLHWHIAPSYLLPGCASLMPCIKYIGNRE